MVRACALSARPGSDSMRPKPYVGVVVSPPCAFDAFVRLGAATNLARGRRGRVSSSAGRVASSALARNSFMELAGGASTMSLAFGFRSLEIGVVSSVRWSCLPLVRSFVFSVVVRNVFAMAARRVPRVAVSFGVSGRLSGLPRCVIVIFMSPLCCCCCALFVGGGASWSCRRGCFAPLKCEVERYLCRFGRACYK